MTKVCHITTVHSNDDVRIFHKECQSLAKAGYEVFFIAPGPSFVKHGITVEGISNNPCSRIVRMFKRTKEAYARALKVNADIYHIHDPELLLVGKKLKRRLGKKIIFDSHEDIPSQILEKLYIKPEFLRLCISKFYVFFQKIILRSYNSVIIVTPHQLKNLSFLQRDKIVMISNYPILKVKEELSIQKDSKNFEICFAGGVNAQWNHDTVINAIEMMENTLYKLCGSSDAKYIKYLKNLKGWEKVDYKGKIPFQDVYKLYQQGSVGVALCSYSPNVGNTLGTLGNNKIFEMMQAGLPVICTDFEIWEEIINTWNCGFTIKPNDISALTRILDYIRHNPKVVSEMSRNGQVAIMKQYNWGVEEPKLLHLYKDILSK